jgi:hypothetical protein
MNDSKKSNEMIVTNLPAEQIRAQIEEILHKQKGEQHGQESQSEGRKSIDTGLDGSCEQESGAKRCA